MNTMQQIRLFKKLDTILAILGVLLDDKLQNTFPNEKTLEAWGTLLKEIDRVRRL